MREILLSQGKIAQVDDEDYEWLTQFKWCVVNQHGYWYVERKIRYGCNRMSQKMHSLIMQAPKGMQVDHINHNGLDNRRSNLRICTRAENQHNRLPIKRNQTSIFKGVTWNNTCHKWRARISINNTRILLGDFNSELEAAHAYDEAARKYYGEFAYTNFRGVINES